MSVELDRLRYDKRKWKIIPEAFDRYKILYESIVSCSDNEIFGDEVTILDDEFMEPDLVLEVHALMFDFWPNELLPIIRSCDEFSISISDKGGFVMRFTIHEMYARREGGGDGILFLR